MLPLVHVHGQTVTIYDHLEVLDNSLSECDSVVYNTQGWLGYMPYSLDSVKHEIVGNVLRVHNYYSSGFFAALSRINDTVVIAPQPAGTYTLQIIAHHWANVQFNKDIIETTIQIDATPPDPNLELPFDQHVQYKCADEVLELNALNNGSLYRWSTGASQQKISIKEPGKYWVQVNSGECSFISDTVEIFNFPEPIITLDERIEFCSEDESMRLDGGDFVSYLWEPSGSTSRYLTVNSAVNLRLTVEDENGCATMKEIVVVDDCNPYIPPAFTEPTLYIPNAFTPDGDGLNEVFKAEGGNLYSITINIYNRWGDLLHTMNSLEESWNGKVGNDEMASGVYVWICDYQYYEGIDLVSERKVGNVLIQR